MIIKKWWTSGTLHYIKLSNDRLKSTDWAELAGKKKTEKNKSEWSSRVEVNNSKSKYIKIQIEKIFLAVLYLYLLMRYRISRRSNETGFSFKLNIVWCTRTLCHHELSDLFYSRFVLFGFFFFFFVNWNLYCIYADGWVITSLPLFLFWWCAPARTSTSTFTIKHKWTQTSFVDILLHSIYQ